MADDTAAKQRIIGHMNADHHDSVVRYLEHFHKLSSWAAYDGKIEDVSLSDITFKCNGSFYRTSIDPPMKSYREARERLVAMDKDCVQALGRSDITIRSCPVPQGPEKVGFVGIIVTMIAFSRQSNFATDSFLGGLLSEGRRQSCIRIQPYLFWGILLIHSVECVWMARGRLRKHNVSTRSPTYWLWLGDVFIQGMGSTRRFDKLVREKQREKAQQKH